MWRVAVGRLGGGTTARVDDVLLYGTEVCPTNAADLQSMQFTINRVIIKLFGTMSQNY